jgi:transposase-like protein
MPVPAVDKAGQAIDFFLSRNRDVNAAKSFLRSAMKNTRVCHEDHVGTPMRLLPRAVREMQEDGELPGRVKVRSSQYLNNLVEQDHRRVTQRIRPMLGFKAIRQRGRNDLRNRASREGQEGAVQDGQARRVRCDDDGTVKRGTRSLSPISNHLQGGA